HSARSRASSTFATAHATDPPVQSSRGKDKTRMIPPAVADGPQSVRQGALSGTSTSTTATIQASSARATDFFNALLDGENGKAVMALLSEVAQDPSRAVLAVTHDHRTLA